MQIIAALSPTDTRERMGLKLWVCKVPVVSWSTTSRSALCQNALCLVPM